MELLKCRVCGHGDSKSLGQIPDCGTFAGRVISPSIKGGELWLCGDCSSMFRHPTLSSADYISLYQMSSGTVWEGGEEERNDFSTIYAYLKNHVGGSILDVGCYAGNFVMGLPDKFKKYGIEPSDLASCRATSKGINVLGQTLDELDSDRVFDVVVAIDVIEHVLDAGKFLSQALDHVKENGLLIISTGNPDCFFWKRVFKSMFWYSLFAEHVTFPSYRYFNEFSVRNGLQSPKRIGFRYLKIKPLERITKILRNTPFILPPALYSKLRIFNRFAKGSTYSNPSGSPVSLIGAFSDHHVVIFRNKD